MKNKNYLLVEVFLDFWANVQLENNNGHENAEEKIISNNDGENV